MRKREDIGKILIYDVKENCTKGVWQLSGEIAIAEGRRNNQK
jgi:hypothetical protein